MSQTTRNLLHTLRPLLNSLLYYNTVEQMYQLHSADNSDDCVNSRRIMITFYRLFYSYCLFLSTRLLTFGALVKAKESFWIAIYLSVDLVVHRLTAIGVTDGNIFIFASPIPLCGLLFHYYIFYKPPAKLMWANFYDLIVRNSEQLGAGGNTISANVRQLLAADRGSRRNSKIINFNINAKLEFFPEISKRTRVKLNQMLGVFLIMQLGTYGIIVAILLIHLIFFDFPPSTHLLLKTFSIIEYLLCYLTIVNIMKVCTFALFNLVITCRFTLLELASQRQTIAKLSHSSSLITHFSLTKAANQFRIEHTRIVRFLQQTKMPTMLFAVFFITNFFFNVYLFTFLYYSTNLPATTLVTCSLILLLQTIGSVGSTIPIVMVNTALCSCSPYLCRLQLKLGNAHFPISKWKLATYAELIDGSSQYLAPRIEAFDQLTKESVLKGALFYIAYLIFFCGKFVEVGDGDG